MRDKDTRLIFEAYNEPSKGELAQNRIMQQDIEEELSEEERKRAEEVYAIGLADREQGNKQKPSISTFGLYSDYYNRGFYGMPFEAEPRSKEEDDELFAKAWGDNIAAKYERDSRTGR